MNAPLRMDLITREIGHIAEQLLAVCGGDDRLYADMLEGETDINAVCSKLLAMIETEEGYRNALTEQMAVRKERRDACDARIETMKAALLKLMGAAMLPTIRLPEATLSRRDVPAKLKPIDAAAVPEQFCTVKYVPSMEKINETFNVDGALPNWLSVEPKRQSLSIRRK